MSNTCTYTDIHTTHVRMHICNLKFYESFYIESNLNTVNLKTETDNANNIYNNLI